MTDKIDLMIRGFRYRNNADKHDERAFRNSAFIRILMEQVGGSTFENADDISDNFVRDALNRFQYGVYLEGEELIKAEKDLKRRKLEDRIRLLSRA